MDWRACPPERFREAVLISIITEKQDGFDPIRGVCPFGGLFVIIECSQCGVLHEKRPEGRRCNACKAKYARRYWQENREMLLAKESVRHKARRLNPTFVEKERQRGLNYVRSLRHEVIMAYGGYTCACCGETEPKFLSLDHVANNGAEHRRAIGYRDGNGKGASSRIWKLLRDNGFPPGYQILCMNCNHGKARNKGVCPHKGSPKQTALIRRTSPADNAELARELLAGECNDYPEREYAQAGGNARAV